MKTTAQDLGILKLTQVTEASAIAATTAAENPSAEAKVTAVNYAEAEVGESGVQLHRL